MRTEQLGRDFTTTPRRLTVASGDRGPGAGRAAEQYRHGRAKEAPPDASTGQSIRTCLRRAVPADHAAHSQAQRRQLLCESARTRLLETTQLSRDAHPDVKARA